MWLTVRDFSPMSGRAESLLFIWMILAVSGINFHVAAESTTNTGTSAAEGSLTTVVTVEEGRVDMPCDISAPSLGDSVYLVLWYRKHSGTPIYSYDSRQTTTDETTNTQNHRPDLWSEPSAFGNRAHFRVTSRPAVLSITGVHKFDAGTYTCRVDFRQSPTVYHHVTLDVIVPPQKPLIIDDRGRQVEGEVGIGPFREGDALTLDCNVSGGEPLPTVLWYLDNQLLDDSFQQTFDSTVRNSLTIRKLEREHTVGRLRCVASNNNITRPVESSVSLKMLFPPQGAKIQGPLQPFTSGSDYYIACKVWGSNPPARVEWFRGTSPTHGLRPLKALNQTVIENGNVTISFVQYNPKPAHHHNTLICRGSNDELLTANSKVVEDYHRMEIYFPPSVELTLGRMVNAQDLEEGDDIYFSCSITANPPAYKLTWWHNGEQVVHNQNNGIIIANQSLVLQKVTRSQAGSYTCEASNVEGDEVSNPVSITIMYKPVCIENQKNIYGVSEGETAHISCRVDSYPEADGFIWTFNTSSGGMDLNKDTFTNQGSASLLSYTPKNQMDYGTVLCMATNIVGRQVVPCVYHVIPAGPPDPPRNCTLNNQTQDSLQVDCVAGFSSGLKQEFHMEVFSLPDHQLIVNISTKSPKLIARGLPPGHSLFLRVYASNVKGRSRSITFDGYTLHLADKHPVVDGASKESSVEKKETWSSFLLIVLLGATITLLIIGVAVGFLAKLGASSAEQRRRAAASANHHLGGAQAMTATAAGLGVGSKDLNSPASSVGIGQSIDLGTASSLYRHDLMHKSGPGDNTGNLINMGFQGNSSIQSSRGLNVIQDKSPDVIPHFNNNSGIVSPGRVGLMNPASNSPGDIHHGGFATLNNGMRHQVRHPAEITRFYNYGPMTNTLNSMTASLIRTGPSSMYSPTGTSDSSGFSERDSGFSQAPPSHNFSRNGNIISGLQRSESPNRARSGSPGMIGGPFGYHNPTLTASPFSTLPRRIVTVEGTRQQYPSPHKLNGPIMELNEGTSTFGGLRAASLGRNSSLVKQASPAESPDPNTMVGHKGHQASVRTPNLLKDDRESCV